MSNHTTRTALPPPHLRWWQCDHEGPGIEGCPVCRKVPDKGAAMWAAGLLRALDRESLALVGSLAAERDRERRRAEAAEAERDALRARAEAAEAALATARAEGAAAERAAVVVEMKAREAAALARSGAAQEESCEAGCDDWDEAGLADWGAAEALRDLAAYIEAGAHVRPVEGA
jgi:hypothetical protein